MRLRFLNGFAFSLLVTVFLVACDSEWKEHYEDKSSGQHDGTVMEYLRSKGDYSKFVALLDKHGLSKRIEKGGANTVFAVKNSAIGTIEGLATAEQLKAMEYHAGNSLSYGYSVKDDGFAFLKTFSGKNIRLSKKSGAVYANRTVKINQLDMVCSNGVVHELNGVLNPVNSIFEQIKSLGDDYKLFKAYVQKDTLLFDKENSPEVGRDILGRPVYDSVFVPRTYYLHVNGDVSNEDSTLTCLVLSDAALKLSVAETIKKYYGSEANIPETLKDDAELLASWKTKLTTKIMDATVWNVEAQADNIPNQIRSVSGSLLSVNKADKIEEGTQSNGYLHTMKKVILLRSDLMGKRLTFESETAPYSSSIENLSYNLDVVGGRKAYSFENKGEPFEITFKCDGLMAGKYELNWTPLASKMGKFDLFIDGKRVYSGLNPRGNWSTQLLTKLEFDAYGTHTVKFKTVEPFNSTDNIYGVAFDNLLFLPVAE